MKIRPCICPKCGGNLYFDTFGKQRVGVYCSCGFYYKWSDEDEKNYTAMITRIRRKLKEGDKDV